MKKVKNFCTSVLLGTIFMSQGVHANNNLTFKGKLIIPSCTVTNTEVDWGDVEIQTLAQNGGNQKDFTVNMTCPYNIGNMKVTITAVNVYNDNAILVTNTSTNKGDGLLIYLNDRNVDGSVGSAITFGTPFTPGYIKGTVPARNISLYAKLGYKGDIQNLQAGAFSATATLVASYV